MNELEKDNVTDLAAFIDMDNNNNDLAAKFNQSNESAIRRTQRLMNENTKPVKPGELFHAHFISAEWANSSTGFPFLRIKVQLDANGWTMSHTHFVDRKRCGSEGEIYGAGLDYLQRFGYNQNLHNLKEIGILVEIGSWKSDDGKEHLNIKRIYRDEGDYESFQKWLASRPQKQTKTREPVELPDDF